MKKILSILLTVTMLLSMVGSIRVPAVQSATYQLMKAPSWMLTSVASSGLYVSYKVINYKMGENIESIGDEAAHVGLRAVLVGGTDYPGAAWTVVQTTNCDTLGHFSLATSNVRYDGLYKVIIVSNAFSAYNDNNGNGKLDPGDNLTGAPTTGGNILWGAYVFIKYVWQLDKPASITYNCQSVTFSGYLRFGSGKGADTVASVTVNYPDFTVAGSSTVQTDGNWAMSVVINKKGYYVIWISDTYKGDFITTTETLNVTYSLDGGATTAGTTNLIAGLDNLGYDSKIAWSTGNSAKIFIDTIVKPTILYAVTAPQEIVIKAIDETGEPVANIPFADWTIEGFTVTTFSEISPSVYKFVGTIVTGSSAASFQAKKVIGGVLVTSNKLSIAFTPFSNPTVILPLVTYPKNGQVVETNMFKIQWTSPSDNFRIQISDKEDFSNLVIDESVTGHEYSIDKPILSYGKTYYLRIKAIEGNIESKWSDVVKFLLPVATLPQPPKLNAKIQGNSVKLEWNKPSEGTFSIAGYAIYRGDKSGEQTLLAKVDSSSLSYEDKTVVKEKTYYYVVKVFDTNDNYSEFSNEVSVSIDGVPPTLEASLPDSVNSEKLNVIGTVKDEGGSGLKDNSIKINGNIVKVNEDGKFSYILTLSGGANYITIEAEDNAENKTVKTFIVNYSKSIVIILQIGNPYMMVNGNWKEIDIGKDIKPVIKNSRTLVPIRAIIEALGGTIGWNGTEKKVTITLKDTVIELWIGKPQATVNGQTKWIDDANHKVMPEIINGRTMLPLRFVAESLGAKVDWEPNTKTITITYPAP